MPLIIYGLFGNITPFRSRISTCGRDMADRRYTLKKTIVLVGMMGAGKSAVGHALSDALGVQFLDSDEEIVKAASMSIADIFERDGEAFFRDREREVIARLLDTETVVLSTGGGAFMPEANRKMISEKGVSVWLNADLPLLWSRVRHRDTRPLLHTKNPRATLAKLYAERVPKYTEADLEVVGDPAYSVADMAEAVIEKLLTRNDVLERG